MAVLRQDSEMGHRYPVEVGQVWRAGPHLICCSDPLVHDVYSDLLGSLTPTMFYSDPPWTNAHLRRFRADAEASAPDHEWTAVYERVLELADALPCFLESGVPGADAVRAILPGPVIRDWRVRYQANTTDYVLHYSGPTDVPEGCDPTGLRTWAVVAHVLTTHPLGVVCDPCCGLGGVPVEAEKAQWITVSNELHPRRVSVTLARLAALGCEVELDW